MSVAALVIVGSMMGLATGWWTPNLVRWGLADATVNAPRTVVIPIGIVIGAGIAILVGPSVVVLAWWWFGLAALVVSCADLARHRLPDRLVVPFGLGGFACFLIAAAFLGAWGDLLRATIAAFLVGLIFVILSMMAAGGMGMGDVKLSPVVGCYLGWLGWESVFIGVLAGFVVGALVAIVRVLMSTGSLSQRMGMRVPFGPSMLAGVAIAAGLPGVI
ncbi:MAG: prepilin peptidase [Candidatus Nanopelagicales bacterium]